MSEACWHDECAVMAVSLPRGKGTAIQAVYDGLRMQQHRGQDGSGMAALVNRRLLVRKELGLVAEVYSSSWLVRPSDCAIGHNRYATQGAPSSLNLQPHRARSKYGPVMVASNGDVTNFRVLRRRLQRQGIRFLSQNDGELLAWVLAREYDRTGSVPEALRRLRHLVVGAYSAVAIVGQSVFAFRDPRGFRPFSYTHLPGGGVAAASETVAFDILGADLRYAAEVPAGAILELSNGNIIVHDAGGPVQSACVFEYVYFARPDSYVFGLPVGLIRRRIGWQLGKERRFRKRSGVIVVSVPDSANEIARGVAEAIGAPFVPGLVRSHTARRTFIENEQRMRDEGVKYKLNPDRFLLEGATVFLVDDSIVRGTTILKIVRMLRHAGVREVHILVGSPPIRWPCFMGIATPTREELVANQFSLASLTRQTEADSLTYLSLEGLREAVGPITTYERRRYDRALRPLLTAQPGSLRAVVLDRLTAATADRHCYACFTGNYPIPVPLSKEDRSS